MQDIVLKKDKEKSLLRRHPWVYDTAVAKAGKKGVKIAAGEMVLVIAGASEEEADAAAPATLSIEDLAVLSVDRAQEDNLRIKDAISQVVAEHPLSDGSLANRKQVYNAVLAMKG